jgi:hypothetical protein
MNSELLEKYEELSRRAVASKHWYWRIGMAALAANDLARLFTPEGDLPIKSEDGVRLISHTYSEARYQFCEHDGVRRAHDKAHVTMITSSSKTDNEDDTSCCWGVGFTHLINLRPDFHDTVTAAGLLRVVRAAWEPRLGKAVVPSPVCTPDGWGVGAQFSSEGFSYIVLPKYSSEVEALVVALEAA